MKTSHYKKSFNLRFHQFALVVVGIGASIGILASTFAWVTRGEFATTLFVTSALALVASYPVLRDYRRMVQAGF